MVTFLRQNEPRCNTIIATESRLCVDKESEVVFNELAMINSRLAALDARVRQLEEIQGMPEKRVVGEIKKARQNGLCFSSRVVTVPTHYYDLSLSERAALLNGSSDQLCKALLFENTSDSSENRFFLVIVQYMAKVSSDKLKDVITRFLREERGECASAHLRVASEADNDRLTGKFNKHLDS